MDILSNATVMYQALQGSVVLQGVGLMGTFFYVLSYAMLQTGKLRGDDILYILLNTAAALCILMSLLKDFNLAAAILQVVWVALSGIGIIRLCSNSVAEGEVAGDPA